MPRRKGAGLWDELKARLPGAKAREEQARAANAAADTASAEANPYGTPKYATLPSARSAPPSPSSSAFVTGRPAFSFAGRRTSMRKAFDRCVKSVRKTVKARNKESAAIAICTKSVLQTRGRTLKRYRKGRLTTQARLRGGELPAEDRKMLAKAALVSGKTRVAVPELKKGTCYETETGDALGTMLNWKPLTSADPKVYFEKGPATGIPYTAETMFVEAPCTTGGRTRKTRRRKH